MDVSVVAAAFTVAGTLLPFSKNPHWAIRMWDFPRNSLAVIGAAAAFALRNHPALRAATTAATAYQAWKMWPYTKLHWRPVKSTRTCDARSLRLAISNVKMENESHEKWIRRIRARDPDVILALETNARWIDALRPLELTHPHVVLQPQENCFGMALYSRLPLVDPEVKFLVEDDIPSIHTGLRLRDGTQIRLYGLHPRPPEPLRDQDSEPRDVELLLVGKEVASNVDPRPTIVAGDLNDVAWSRTTERFVSVSGLLDPRVGRGMFNSYNAKNPLARWPLDHVFHSREFELRTLKRLGHVGSDHFPMHIEIRLT